MTKEEIHDQQIEPLMAQILEICQEHGIAMISSYALDATLMCTSHLPDGDGAYNAIYLRALRHMRPEMFRHPDVVAVTVQQGKPS